MFCKVNKYSISFLVVLFCTSSIASAQMFERQVNKKTEAEIENPWLANPRNPNSKNNVSVPKKSIENSIGAEKDSNTPPKKEYVYPMNRPTLDGVERGDVYIQPVVNEKDLAETEDRFIFVYYKNFDIRKTMSGTILCDVRFVVLSTLDRKINNISLKLSWPQISTPLSYNDVGPNIETYFDYTLIGEGCYSMDKTPNIIVNRCRVVGMTQKDCAQKIHWLHKS